MGLHILAFRQNCSEEARRGKGGKKEEEEREEGKGRGGKGVGEREERGLVPPHMTFLHDAPVCDSRKSETPE